ncbi:MAG: TVP38/TMEM64 family protein [Sandaracinaceae bacterium]
MLSRLKTPAPWLLLAFGLGVWAVHRWVTDIGGPEVIDARYGIAAPVVMVGIQTLLSAAPFPSELWALASSALYGWLPGTVMTWAGWTMGSMIQYGLARRGMDDLAATGPLDERLARLPAWLRRLPLTHPVFLVVVRWFPMGFHLANLTAGARRVPAGRQLAIAAVGSAPGAALWAAIGAGAATGLSWT